MRSRSTCVRRALLVIDCLGLSSYPYLGGFADPESLPLGYYARLRAESARPVLVVEGGWTSIALGAFASRPAEQAPYLEYQDRLLDSARAIAVSSIQRCRRNPRWRPGTQCSRVRSLPDGLRTSLLEAILTGAFA